MPPCLLIRHRKGMDPDDPCSKLGKNWEERGWGETTIRTYYMFMENTIFNKRKKIEEIA